MIGFLKFFPKLYHGICFEGAPNEVRLIREEISDNTQS